MSLCTRPKGHTDGPHVYHSLDGAEVLRWGDDTDSAAYPEATGPEPYCSADAEAPVASAAAGEP